ncbi:hypothetical protein [Amycolatopsis sp. PS_44_ISF1]|uniref:hypothetical protein n=1 Tax=Amycolatopsis sp. PS_44_ISF1 TaxID=2974917 RepID=UPI0028E03FA6|nr:hypothetical protein [Amycolatopsis sp. PS_44_ISF1]MDT8914477.1 hypothetical protein [Amycolatopsis sp. PS_44_ISF1]
MAERKKFAWWSVVITGLLAVAALGIALAVPGAGFMQYVAVGLFVGAVATISESWFKKS